MASDTREARGAADDATLTIGQLARLTGVRAKTIRYYESVELLPHPSRGENRYRRYGSADVNRLLLLRRMRLLGVPLSSAKRLLADATDARCAEVQRELLALLDERQVELAQQIVALSELRGEVERYQRAVAVCHPDEATPFATCGDISCLGVETGERRAGAVGDNHTVYPRSASERHLEVHHVACCDGCCA